MIGKSEHYDVNCPDCGSDEIEIVHWEAEFQFHAKARCECGFSHRESYATRDMHAVTDELSAGMKGLPLEVIHNEEPGVRFRGELGFSPRKFLESDESTTDLGEGQK